MFFFYQYLLTLLNSSSPPPPTPTVRRVSPKFSGAPSDVRIPPGNDVNLTCVAVGSPMPYVKWRQGAQDLTGDDNIPIGRNTLILTDVRMSKNYTCEASSDLGNIEHHVQVIVEGKPHL